MPAALAFRQNRFLGRLPEAVQARLSPHMQTVWLQPGVQLGEPGAPLPGVYFPLPCTLISRQVLLPGGETVCVGLMSDHTAVGSWEALGVAAMPWVAVARSAGHAARIPTDILRDEARRSADLRILLLRHAQATASEAAHTAACIAFHPTERRCATLLLRLDDALGGRQIIPIAQERLSELLGVRRPTVTTLLGGWRRKGLIETRRNAVVLGSRPEMGKQACECYDVLRLLGQRL